VTRGPGPSLCLSLSWEPTVTTAVLACSEVDDRSFVSAVNTPYLHYWIKANKLSKNELLKTANGSTATVIGGMVPSDSTGWMWDLTVPGNNDHDFYVVAEPGRGNDSTYGGTTIGTPVLVHNCDPFEGTSYTSKVQAQMSKGPGEWHSFPESVKSFVTPDDVSTEMGNDGELYTHVRVPGGYGDDEGVFHWIIDDEGVINHRQFEPY
jgi:hypothetical protein